MCDGALIIEVDTPLRARLSEAEGLVEGVVSFTQLFEYLLCDYYEV